MLRWITGRKRLWAAARRLRREIRQARPGSRPQRSSPPFGELLAEAVRLQDEGRGYEVQVTPEQYGQEPWEHRPEQVRLTPAASE